MKRLVIAICLVLAASAANAQRWSYSPPAWPTPQQVIVTHPTTGRSSTVWVTPTAPVVPNPIRITVDSRGNIRTSFEFVPGLVIEPDED